MAFDGTYDPEKQDVVVGDIPLVGYVKGSFIKAVRDEPGWVKHKGSDRRGARTRNANRGGGIIVTLMASSPSNKRLSDLCTEDEENGDGLVDVMVKDRATDSAMCHADVAWIQKHPDYERANELGQIEWYIDCDELEIVHAGLSGAVGP